MKLKHFISNCQDNTTLRSAYFDRISVIQLKDSQIRQLDWVVDYWMLDPVYDKCVLVILKSKEVK